VLLPSPSVGVDCRSVCWFVRWVNCGKTADWIWMPFGVVSRVGRGMGVLHWVEIVEEEGQFWGKSCVAVGPGASHCNYWGHGGIFILCHEGW